MILIAPVAVAVFLLIYGKLPFGFIHIIEYGNEPFSPPRAKYPEIPLHDSHPYHKKAGRCESPGSDRFSIGGQYNRVAAK
jgi:hypothetical protein